MVSVISPGNPDLFEYTRTECMTMRKLRLYARPRHSLFMPVPTPNPPLGVCVFVLWVSVSG